MSVKQNQALERCEQAAWLDLYQSAALDSATACGLEVQEVEGALITLALQVDVLAMNRVIGIGVAKHPTTGSLDRILEAVEASGVPRFFFQIAPWVLTPPLPGWLEKRGLWHYNNWVKLVRDVEPAVKEKTDLTIREIDAENSQVFGDIIASCFGWPEVTSPWIAGTVGRPGWHHYMAFDGNQGVATGAFHAKGKQAWLDMAATLPEFRNRGAQSALLARRIQDAGKLGCTQLVVETAEHTLRKPAPSLQNMRRFGFEVAYVRPNYIYGSKDPAAA